jgi:methyl-accepting chemotaxis protein
MKCKIYVQLQGLNASSLSKRDFFGDLTSAVNNAVNTVSQAAQYAEQQANATIQAALASAMQAVNDGIAAANAAVGQINNIIQDITGTANAVVANAVQQLDALEDMVEADIKNFTNVLMQYGNATLSCISNYSDAIQSVITTSGKL